MANLSKLATALNLEYQKPHAYGIHNGFNYTIEETLSSSVYIFYFLIDEITSFQIESFSTYIKQSKKAMKIQAFDVKGFIIRIVWNNYFGTMTSTQLLDFIDKMTTIFTKVDFQPSQTCGICGKPEATSLVKVNGIIMFKAHEECKTAKLAELKQEQGSAPVEKPNYVGGVLGAIIGAFIGTIPWILVELYIGFYAAVLGILIGYASFYAYKKFGGPLNNKAKYIIAASTILGVLFTNVFFASYIIYYAQGAFVFDNYILVYTDPEVSVILFKDLGLGLLMSVFALPTIINKVKSEEKRQLIVE